jgi:putative zinc finger protein
MSQQTMDCSEARVSLGVYVLGAIDPAERTQVDSHLATCRDCRDELAGLAGLPALLARVSTEEAIALSADEPAPLGLLPDAGFSDTELPDPQAARAERTAASGAGDEPPRELLGAVLDLTAARRRRRNWRNITLTAAAAVVIAAGAFGGARLAAGPAQPAQLGGQALNYGPAGSWLTATGSTQGMDATVMYRQVGWGTQLAAKVVGIPVDTTCQLWVVGPGGNRVLAGSWTTDNLEGTIWYSAGTSTPQPDVHEFVVTVDGHQPITVHA